MHSKSIHSASKTSGLSAGFTLVELMVVVAIMLIITTTILIQSSKSRQGLELLNIAYDVALTVREAQLYGIAVRETSDVASNLFDNFGASYGVYVSTNDPSVIKIFADKDKNNRYTAGAGEELKGSLKLKNNYVVKNICSGTSCPSPATLDIQFIRPNPEAIITFNGSTVQSAFIEIGSSDSLFTERVNIYQNGQISVGDDS